VEAILDKVAELIKAGKAKEIADMRDETDLSGLKLAIDLKRGVDPDKLMMKLYKQTPLEDSFACNFNVLIAGSPQVLGVRQILEEWTAWRTESVRRRVFFVMKKKQDKLHLLKGLKRILLDIDKAIKIIRETEEEAEVIPNLMIGFGIDQIQAEYVAEIKLRNINKEYILKRTQETAALQDEIEDLENTLNDPKRLKKIIVDELNDAAKKYGEPRRTTIIYSHEVEVYKEEEHVEEYPVTVFLSREGYFKKITPQSLRMASEQKYKEGDALRQSFETTSAAEIMFFTDKCQVYKTRLTEFDDTKASSLGDYLPAKLGLDAGENIIYAVLPGADYAGALLFFFENGKAARVDLKAYQTTSNRRKLTGAYSDKAPLARILRIDQDCELAVYSTEPRCLIFHTALLAPKTTRTTQGVAVMTMKPKYHLEDARPLAETSISNQSRYRVRAVPAAGALLRQEDSEEQQINLLD
jgi:DNA gyrase subunit A